MSELEPEGKVRTARNITINAICILLAIGGIAWAVHFFVRYSRYEITNDAVVEQFITPINTRISGYVQSVRFTEHQFVHAGDTLLVIDDRELRIKLANAEADLMDAEAGLGVMHSTVNTARNNVSVSEANIGEAKARLWKVGQDYKRYTNLLKEEAVSQQAYEQVKAEYEAAQARYNALVQQRESSQFMSKEATSKVAVGDANIVRRKADLDMAKLNLSYTVITAPYDGHMGRCTMEPGQLLQAGQMVGNIIRSNQKWITANYKETQISNIFVGQEVIIKVDAFRGKVFKGKVMAISEATGAKFSLIPIDNSAGNFVKVQQRIPVWIDFVDVSPEDLSRLRAGMMVITEAKIK